LISYIGTRSVKWLAFFGVFHLNLPVIEWRLAVHLLNGVLSFIRLSVSYVSKSSWISSIVILDDMYFLNLTIPRKNLAKSILISFSRDSSYVNNRIRILFRRLGLVSGLFHNQLLVKSYLNINSLSFWPRVDRRWVLFDWRGRRRAKNNF
jgi:hypothetical protein